MNKVTKKLFAVVLAMVMTVASISIIPAEEPTTKTAYVTIEKFTIGQGFVLTPTKVEFNEGDTVDTVVNKAAEAEGIELVYNDTGYGAYLSGIKNADNGTVNIPEAISAMGTFSSYGMEFPAPTNDNVTPNTNPDGLLSEYTYTSMAGWYYFVNNVSGASSMSTTTVNDGDVIRLQFSIYGWGLDLGSADWETGKKKINLANKDTLIKTLAEIKAREDISKSVMFKKLYDLALETMAEYNSDENAALELIETISNENTDKVTKEVTDKVTKEVTDKVTKEVTDKVTKEITDKYAAPVVKNSKVKKITNVKGFKAKVQLKAIKGVSGYQYKYATNKKLKNAVVKETKNTTFKVGKIAKNKRVYVAVRTFIKKDGAYYYSGWSKAKSVKIRK
jgi:hypothetical protein